MLSYAPSSNLKLKAEAELERRNRQRQRQAVLRDLAWSDFASRTQIKVPTGKGEEDVYTPFNLWPMQVDVLQAMEQERLLAILKARQLGISWLVCLYALRLCVCYPGQEVLFLSRGQGEANKLTERTLFLHDQHQSKESFPLMLKDNTGKLLWENGSQISSVPATKNAGRGDTASLVVLDEWAFMQWPQATMDAIKPTIDAGGKLFAISSADGSGTTWNQFWLNAQKGLNGYRAIFIPWYARPERGPDWRNQVQRESNEDAAVIKREYPENDLEAFTNAKGQIYAGVWSDGPDDGNVTEAAEYVPDGGGIYWALDDGYAGKFDHATGMYTADSHPRCFLLVQETPTGQLHVFAEHYAVELLSDIHIEIVEGLGFPMPEEVAIDSAAAELRGRLHALGYYTKGKPANVEESIKHLRRFLGPDTNKWRRILVHPRCTQLRKEMSAYRRDEKGKPIEAFDHGPSALRYLAWAKRHE